MGDLISRQEAIELLSDYKDRLLRALDCMDMVGVERRIAESCFELIKACIEDIESLQSVQPEQKAGKWLIRKFGADAQCSKCKMYFSDVYDLENSDAYCRHCGTKMEGLKVITDE